MTVPAYFDSKNSNSNCMATEASLEFENKDSNHKVNEVCRRAN